MCKGHLVTQATKDLQVPEHKALQVILVTLELQVYQVILDIKDLRGYREYQAIPAIQALQVYQDTPATKGLQEPEPKEHQDTLGIPV